MFESPRSLSLRLFFLSFLILFLEVVLIRWVSTEIRVFAYIKNLPLLASFLGIGIGSLLAGRQFYLFPRGAAPLLALVVLVAFTKPLHLTNLIFPGSNYAVWGGRDLPHAEFYWELTRFTGSMVIVTALIVLIFISLGQELGSLMGRLPALAAYQWNILGSLLGVIGFAVISYLSAATVWWVGIIAALWIALLTIGESRSRTSVSRLLPSAMCLLLIPLAVFGGRNAIWSPYYRIDVREIPESDSQITPPAMAGYYVDVNHDYHQKVVNLSEEFGSKFESPFLNHHRFVYDLPYQFDRPKQVLVVGSGTGNDVASALRNGANHVFAVEIDPTILALGQSIHPEHPYESSRVSMINDDARHFFHTTTQQFDHIIFGHIDSHTMLSSMSSVRLDNFVYTKESLTEAYSLLSEDGLMVLSFAGGLSFPTERIYRMLKDVAGREPLVFKTDYDSTGITLVVTRSERMLLAPANLAAIQIKLDPKVVGDATDDWPYLYLSAPSIPAAYVWTFLILCFTGILARFLTRRWWMDSRQLGAWPAFNWPMLLLGAGFMLLETKSITSLSLFYGSTWIVNSVVIAVILLAIFLSNLAVMNFPRIPLNFVFTTLILSLLVNYSLRMEQYVSYVWWVRTLIAAVLLGVPIFCAGVIFSRLFQQSARRDQALGWNLVGAMFGGLLENLSMIWGLNLLNVIAAACYLALALILWRSVGSVTEPIVEGRPFDGVL